MVAVTSAPVCVTTALQDEVIVSLPGHVQPTVQLDVSNELLLVTVTLAVKPPCHWSEMVIATAQTPVLPELPAAEA